MVYGGRRAETGEEEGFGEVGEGEEDGAGDYELEAG